MRIHSRLIALATIGVAACALLTTPALASSTATPAPSSVSGYLVVNSAPVDSTSPSLAFGTVTCPPTSTGVAREPLNGGVTSASHSLLVSVNTSCPDGNQWVGGLNNRSGAPTTFTVWAVCAIPGSGYTQADTETGIPPPKER
jgi:hypothetical protein